MLKKTLGIVMVISIAVALVFGAVVVLEPSSSGLGVSSLNAAQQPAPSAKVAWDYKTHNNPCWVTLDCW